MPESRFDLVRPGILFYGASPSPDTPATIPVRQALRWVTRVVYFKVVKPGNPVSYGSAWAPSELTRVVTLPAGYGDGYMRAMSGKAEVLLHGKRYPIVGRICMDQMMVSIGWDSAHNGDEAVLLGGDGAGAITIEELAAWAGTITHEVLTSINTRVPRVYRG
jgi:alanine racemase